MNRQPFSLPVLEGMLEASPMGVLLVRMEDLADDRSFRTLYINRAAERMLGTTRDRVAGTLAEANSPGLRQRGFIDRFARVIRSGQPEVYDDIYYADERLAAAFSGHIERIAEDLLVVWFENTTERKKVEAEAAKALALAREAEDRAKLLAELENAHAATADALDTHELVTMASGEVLWEVSVNEAGQFGAGKVSPRLAELLGYEPAELPEGVAAITYVTHPEDRQKHMETWRRLRERPDQHEALEYRSIAKTGLVHHFVSTVKLALDGRGQPRKAVGAIRDVTEQRKAEAELRERIELVESQRNLIDELSAPILDVWEDVIALPIVGALDDRRAASTMMALLEEITRQGARFALVDLTGVEAVDAATAEHVVRIAQAVDLLGAHVIITGVQPGVAKTLVELGVDLSKIESRQNLRQGIAECMARLRRMRK